MEETSAVIRGVTWELIFFARAFFLGFCLRMAYDVFLLLRKLWRHRQFLITVEDFVFWMTGSILMFGLLFEENNGTPRLFALAGVLAGMLLYHLGPSPIVCGLFDRFLAGMRRGREIIVKSTAALLKKLSKNSKIKKKDDTRSDKCDRQDSVKG